MGLFSIYSWLLSKGIHCNWVDLNVQKDSYKLLHEYAKTSVVAGITCMTTEIKSALIVSKKLKELNPEIVVVWGGIHPSLFPEQVVNCRDVDYACVGDGEETIEYLFKALVAKKDLSDVPNLVYRKPENSEIINNFRKTRASFDYDPFPAYKEVQMEQYVQRGYKGEETKTFPVITGIGCPYSCSFCIDPLMRRIMSQTKAYIAKSAEKIFEEVEYLVNEYSVEYIRFRDELFFTDRSRIEKLLSFLEKKKIKFSWRANCRIDLIGTKTLPVSLLERCVRNGLIDINFGIESGSDRILSILNKDLTVNQIKKGIALVEKMNITTGYSFMVGIPGETYADLIKTHELLNWIRCNYSNVVIYGPQLYRPYPGSRLFESCERYGLKVPNTLVQWDDFLYNKSEDGERYNFVGGYIQRDKLPWIKEDMTSILNYILRVGPVQLSQAPELNNVIIEMAYKRQEMNFWDNIFEDNILQLTKGQIKNNMKIVEVNGRYYQ